MSFSHWAERKRIPVSNSTAQFYSPYTGCLTGTLLEASAVPTASLSGLSSSMVYLRPQVHCPHPHKVNTCPSSLQGQPGSNPSPLTPHTDPSQGLAGLLSSPGLLPLSTMVLAPPSRRQSFLLTRVQLFSFFHPSYQLP